MSKVALRVYNREIETLVDQGHIDEAIAHCQHILKTFPKHLETYRLLGKAYLEGHRYPDAGDIFQRVLLTVPDDFISQLGMSIVCDEQKDLEGAIWHMERAFEVNPSNGGVQGELRRLYGRRDGLEPPKIRLTRGALAQMYTKGGQNQQAIAEIKSVLGEDPTRVEMKVLLARAFYRGGQKVEATEICIELLKQFPYCLDANRILVEVLPGTSLAQNLDTYKKRIQGLDPYAALVTGSIFDTDSVADNAVTLERLDWDPGSGTQPYTGAPHSGQSGDVAIPDFLRASGWGPSTGEFKEGPVDFDSDSSAPAAPAEIAAAQIPDWLKAMAPPETAAPPVSQQDSAAPTGGQDVASEDLDWLASLGGTVAGATAAAGSQPLENSVAPAGDVPDWLKDMGGPAVPQQPAAEPAAPAASGDVPDWLKDLGGAATPQAPVDEPPTQPAPAVPAASGDVPDWLKDLGGAAMPQAPVDEPPTQPAPAVPAEGLPDWLQGLGGSPADQSSSGSEPQPAGTASADDTLDWLKNLGGVQDQAAATSPDAIISASTPAQPAVAQPAAADEMDWLNNLSGASQAAAPQVESSPQSPRPEANVRKDLSADDEDIPPLSAPISGPGTSESEQDDAMKWLESLAQKQGAKAEELITNPAERTANAPDWVAKVDEVPAEPKPAGQGVITAKVAQEKPVDLGDDAPPGELSPLISGGPGTTSSEQDDAMKWLESLAEKQGAKAEELITNPAERTASAPDWVAKVDEAPVAPKPAGREVVTAKFTPEPPIEVGDEAPLGELSPLISGGPGTTSSEQDDAMKWLESLAEKQGAKPEELITNPAERTAAAPDWVGQVENPPTPLSAPVSGPGTTAAEHDDAMKWLESLAAGQGAKPEELITNPTERTDEPPAWVTQRSAEAAPPSSSEQDDTMAWLQSLAAGQPAPTEPTTPSAAAVASSGDDVPPQPVAPMPWEQEIPAAAPEPASDVSEWLKGLDAQEPAQPSQPAAQAPAPVVPPEPAAPPQQQVSPVQPPTIAAQPVAPQPVAPQPIPAASTDDVIPDWLKDMRDPAGPPQASQEDLPDWLKDEKSPEVGLAPMWMPADIPPASVPTSSVVKPPAPPAPAAPQQTQPAPVAAAPVTPPAAPVGPAAPSTPPVSVAASTPAPAQPVMPPPQVAAVQPPASPAPSSPARLPARDSGLIGDKDGPALQKARDLMDQKNLDLAIGEYGKLVKRGKLLEEVIYDLKAATYSHPVDVIVWQALGDAHMRANQLQEALDAYSKAEELLR